MAFILKTQKQEGHLDMHETFQGFSCWQGFPFISFLWFKVIDLVQWVKCFGNLVNTCAKIDEDRRKTFDSIMIYFWWNVWKERNRRIFQNKSLQPRQVALLCKEEVEQYQLARGNNGSSSCYIVRPGFLLLSVFCFLFGVRWLTGGADGRETVLVGHLCRLV